jgi:tetratricopeptide (TPR) repeat protein
VKRYAAPTLVGQLLPAPIGVGVLSFIILLAGLWALPGSPVTLWRADGALGRGDAALALRLYDDVGDSGWTRGLRKSALSRSASLLATEHARPDAARSRLDRLLRLERDSFVRASVRERVGHLWLGTRDIDLAVRSFVGSVDEAPRAERAPERLAIAGRTAMEAGRLDLAEALWDRLAEEYPRYRAVARLGHGRVALLLDDAQAALRWFDEAHAFATSADERAAARLGASTALERLGNLDEAIAELDNGELPSTVRGSRLDSLRTRRDVRGR